MEDSIDQADPVTVFQETWALLGVVKGFHDAFISRGSHSNNNTQFIDKLRIVALK